jgi:predicted nucleic acid-binding protein
MSAGAAVISNAGPLMVLAKLNLLHLLKSLYGRVGFSRSVYTETVIEGMRQGYEDAYRLEDFFRVENWVP